nr:hypothetical protein Iba_chr15cCG0410 [Ipomoea batatas]
MERNRCCHQENKEKLLHWPIIRAREAGSGLNTLVKMKELQCTRALSCEEENQESFLVINFLLAVKPLNV